MIIRNLVSKTTWKFASSQLPPPLHPPAVSPALLVR